MPQSRWPADAKGRYWIDIALGSRELSLMVDSGLVDFQHQAGFSIDPFIFDRMRQSHEFVMTQRYTIQDASGRSTKGYTGLIAAQLIDPISRQRIGPVVNLFTVRGSPKVPSRVGVEFFHHLTGCRVIWDLDKRIWCIEHP